MTPIGKPVVFGVMPGDEFRYLTGRGLDPETVQTALQNTWRMKNLLEHPELVPTPDLGTPKSTPTPPRKPLTPRYDPFANADQSPKMQVTASLVGSRPAPTLTDVENIGAELGRIWRNPRRLADALGVPIVSQIELHGMKGEPLRGRTILPPFGPLIQVNTSEGTLEGQNWVIGHELAHYLWPSLQGREDAEKVCDAFGVAYSEGWNHAGPQ